MRHFRDLGSSLGHDRHTAFGGYVCRDSRLLKQEPQLLSPCNRVAADEAEPEYKDANALLNEGTME